MLKAKPISHQLKESKSDVYGFIAAALKKCADSLDVELTPERCKLLTDDIIEVYLYDSVEDVMECLKKGRQGKYSFEHHNRNKLNLPLIHSWMAKHLDEKAEMREKELSKLKQDQEPLEEVDYEAYRLRVSQPKEKPTNFEENAYQRFRESYLREKGEEEKKENNETKESK